MINLDKADIVDTTHVDAALASVRRNEENARRRAMIWTVSKSVLIGGVGIGALLFGASFLVQPKASFLVQPKIVETKVVEVPKVVEAPAQTVAEAGQKPRTRPGPCSFVGPNCHGDVPDAELQPSTPLPKLPVVESPPKPLVVQPKKYDPCYSPTGSHCEVKEATPPPPTPAPNSNAGLSDFLARCEKFGYDLTYCDYLLQHYPELVTGKSPMSDAPRPTPTPTTEKHPWAELSDKEYVGQITDIVDGAVCYDHDMMPEHCTHLVVIDATGHAVLDNAGNPVFSPDHDLSPMRKWIGYSAYKAARPEDPSHLADFWVADNGELIKFESAPIGPHVSKADSVAMHTYDGGRSLLVYVGLGTSDYALQLDTGASDITVTNSVADYLVRNHGAAYGPEQEVQLADGSHVRAPTLTIDAVRVGSHWVRHVSAGVSPDGAPMLLGMSVLNEIGRFTVDVPNRRLIFNGDSS